MFRDALRGLVFGTDRNVKEKKKQPSVLYHLALSGYTTKTAVWWVSQYHANGSFFFFFFFIAREPESWCCSRFCRTINRRGCASCTRLLNVSFFFFDQFSSNYSSLLSSNSNLRINTAKAKKMKNCNSSTRFGKQNEIGKVVNPTDVWDKQVVRIHRHVHAYTLKQSTFGKMLVLGLGLGFGIG